MSDQPSPAPSSTSSSQKWNEVFYANKLELVIGITKTVAGKWFHYADETGVWREGNAHIHRPTALRILPDPIRSERRASTLLKHLESKWQVPAETFKSAIVVDEHTGDILLNVLNGVLRVTPTTISLEKHCSTHHFTRVFNTPYLVDATCPIYLRVLGDCLPDALDQELFLTCLGNFLLPDCRFEACLVCYGEAGSGKSTLADPISLIMGTEDDGLLTRLSMGQICDPRSYSLYKLHRACVNLGTELQSIEVDESANFKTLVSGEPIEARPIYDHPFTMRPHCKLWFLANSIPRFRNGTEAELRRMRFLRFESKPTKPDVLLKKKLTAEVDGIFALMVQHLQKLLSMDTIPLGGSHSQSVHTRFQVSNDPLGTFLRRHCVLGPTAQVSKEDLKQSFLSYCQIHSLPEKLNDTFFKNLYERETGIEAARANKGGVRTQVLTGITLKPDAPKELDPTVSPTF